MTIKKYLISLINWIPFLVWRKKAKQNWFQSHYIWQKLQVKQIIQENYLIILICQDILWACVGMRLVGSSETRNGQGQAANYGGMMSS